MKLLSKRNSLMKLTNFCWVADRRLVSGFSLFSDTALSPWLTPPISKPDIPSMGQRVMAQTDRGVFLLVKWKRKGKKKVGRKGRKKNNGWACNGHFSSQPLSPSSPGLPVYERCGEHDLQTCGYQLAGVFFLGTDGLREILPVENFSSPCQGLFWFRSDRAGTCEN